MKEKQMSLFGTIPEYMKKNKVDREPKLFANIPVEVIEKKKEYELEDIKCGCYVRLKYDALKVNFIGDDVLIGESVITKKELKFTLDDVYNINDDFKELLRVDDVIIMRFSAISRPCRIIQFFKSQYNEQMLYVRDEVDQSLEIKKLDDFVRIKSLGVYNVL